MTLRATRREFREIPLGLIDDPKLPSRSTMDEQKLDELVTSIAQLGLMQPISVGRVGDRYEVIAGHRRTMASKRAGLVAVPCVVYDSVDAAHEALKFAENRYREDLNPAEEAIYFNELLERDCGGDVDKLCEQLGAKRVYVEGRLNLFLGDGKVFEALQDGKIGIGVAQEINRCTDESYRRYLLNQAIVGGATRAVVSGWILDWQKQERLNAGAPAPSSSSAPLAAIPETNFFRCYVCKGTELIHTMQPVNIHAHCQLATLDKALEQFARRGEQLLYPRTTDEARALVQDLLDRFPDLVPSTA